MGGSDVGAGAAGEASRRHGDNGNVVRGVCQLVCRSPWGVCQLENIVLQAEILFVLALVETEWKIRRKLLGRVGHRCGRGR